jgi:hypothetical protein
MKTGYLLQITAKNRYAAGNRTLVCPVVFPTAAAAWEHEQQWAKAAVLSSYEYKHDDWTPEVMPVPVLPEPNSQDPLDKTRSLDQRLLLKVGADGQMEVANLPKPKDCRTDSCDSLRNGMADRMDEKRRAKKEAIQRRIDFLQHELKALD